MHSTKISLMFLIVGLLGAILGTFGPVAILLTFSPLALLWVMNWDENHYQNYVRKGK